MKILYNKYTDYRKKEYQIYTQIVEEDGAKKVLKKNVYECGLNHIKEFVSNSQRLSEVYDSDMAKPLPCVYEDNAAVCSFISGTSYQQILETLCEEKNKEGIQDFLKKYMKLIEGKKSNQSPFQCTKEFENWFGDGKEFQGLLATTFTNLDCNVGNVIVNDEGTWIMDYEWCFSFPIPVDFVKYLNLSWLFYFDVPAIQKLYSFEEILSICSITGNIEKYKQMEQNHGRNIDEETNTKVNMLQLKNKSLNQQIINAHQVTIEFHQLTKEDEIIDKYRVTKQIDGVSHHMSISLSVKPDACKIKMYVLDSGVVSMKWIRIQSESKPVQFRPLNGYYDGEYVFFDAEVPVMEVYGNGSENKEITFSAHIYSQFDKDLIDIYHRNAVIRNERNSMALQIKGITDENEGLKSELSMYKQKYEEVINSRSWGYMMKLHRIINAITRRK